MDEIAGSSKPCDGGHPSLEPQPDTEPERPMSYIAAACIVAFLAVMAILNKAEFGRFD